MILNIRLYNIKEYFLWVKICVDVFLGFKFEYGVLVLFLSSLFDKKWF